MPVTISSVRERTPNLSIQRLAVELLDQRRAMYEAHDADVHRWYRHRHINEGHSYPTCIHGTSNWTDYDNICGACEDGYMYFDYLRDARECLDEAVRRWERYWEAFDIYMWMHTNHYDAEKAGQFSQWAHNKYLVVR